MESFADDSGFLYSISCAVWDNSVFIHTREMGRDSKGLSPSPCACWTGLTYCCSSWFSWHATPAMNCQCSRETLHLQTLSLIHSKSSRAGFSICMLQLWYQTEQQHIRGMTHSHFQGNNSIFKRKRNEDAGDLVRKIIMKEVEKQ